MENLIIRNEEEKDYKAVLNVTREAFYNIYRMGCDEHYLVKILKGHKDYLPNLCFVAEVDDEVIGSIIYTKAKIVDESGEEREVLTFGPFSILPKYQRCGIGRKLLSYSLDKALVLGYGAVVIFGSPSNYVSSGFKSSKRFNVCMENVFPTGMLVKELAENFFDGRKWTYNYSSVYDVDFEEAEKFDKEFPIKEKKFQASQEEFYILSNSLINE